MLSLTTEVFPMSAVPKLITAEQYLAQERVATFKSEFFAGEVFAMAGGTPNHSLIAANFAGEARGLLKGRPCKVFNSELRVKVNPTGLYTYPDASIVCGELQFDDGQEDTVTNPIVLVEVLSESTEKYDRGAKSGNYRRIASLKEIVLISQYETSVERFTRQENGGWLLVESQEMSDELRLESVGISIPLSELYRGVVFRSRASEEGT
jgi:Uma2 family endonuclease